MATPTTQTVAAGDRSKTVADDDRPTAPPGPDPRPKGGYAVLLAGYGALTASLVLTLRRRRQDVQPLGATELVAFGLATEHLSRIITRDSITSVVRSPFTRFDEPAGEGESNETVVGTGLRHAVGELLTCPFCIGQWVATALMVGRLVVPRFATAVVSVAAAARLSDHLQEVHGYLREHR